MHSALGRGVRCGIRPADQVLIPSRKKCMCLLTISLHINLPKPAKDLAEPHKSQESCKSCPSRICWRHPRSSALVFKKCLQLLRDSSASFLVVISPLVKKGRQEKDSPGKSTLLCLTFPRFSMWSNRIHFNACLRTISPQKGWRENGKSMNSILFPMSRHFLCLFVRRHKTIESCSRWVCFRTTSRSMGSSQSLPIQKMWLTQHTPNPTSAEANPKGLVGITHASTLQSY